MDKLNTYFVPLSISMLPEYIASGFIGLPSSKEPGFDIQSLGYPNVSVVNSIEDVPMDVCFEINTPEIAKEIIKKNHKYLILSGPISIARTQRIIFFDQEMKDNFVASFQMLPDLPIDFFELTLEVREITPKTKMISAPRGKRSYNISDGVNQLTSLNIGIVVFYQTMDLQLNDLQLNYISKGSKIDTHTICYELIIKILNELVFSEKTKEYEFDMLGLYFWATSTIKTSRGLSGQFIVDQMMGFSQSNQLAENLHNDKKHTRFNKNKINPVIPRILQKTQNILIGIESLDTITNDKLVLQRSIFLACIADDYESLLNWAENLKPHKTILAIATLLVLYRTRTNFLPAELWRKDRKNFDQFFILSEQIAREKCFSLKITKSVDKKEFYTHSKLTINDTEISSRKVEFDPEIMKAIYSLKALKYKPKPTPDGLVLINVTKNDTTVPIILQLKQCPITLKKRNFIISAMMDNLSQHLDKKKTRIELLSLTHYYMVSFGVGDKGTEISRYQLADTMDKEELIHHIELVTNAYIELNTRFGLS